MCGHMICTWFCTWLTWCKWKKKGRQNDGTKTVSSCNQWVKHYRSLCDLSNTTQYLWLHKSLQPILACMHSWIFLCWNTPGLVAVLGVCLAATDDSVTSLVDVISSKDQARLFKSLEAAQPYEDVRSAYLMIRGLQSLGITDAGKNVSTVLLNASISDFNTFLFVSIIR